MSDWQIRFTKDHTARAWAKDKYAFAIGYNGGGRAEAFMDLTDEQATTLWCMANEMKEGMPAREALEVVEKRIEDHKAKIAARPNPTGA